MKRYIPPVVLLTLGLLWDCGRSKADDPAPAGDDSKAQVTFVELGSVNCIPCKAMQPIMKAVEEEYGDQVKVVFHDVWKDPEPGKKYGIRLIPTQVFLDDKGVEFHRHEGFYPQEEIDKILMGKGLKKKTATGKS